MLAADPRLIKLPLSQNQLWQVIIDANNEVKRGCESHTLCVRMRGKSRGKAEGGLRLRSSRPTVRRRPIQQRMEEWSRPKSCLRVPTQLITAVGGSVPCTQPLYFRGVLMPPWKSCPAERRSFLPLVTSRNITRPCTCPRTRTRRALGTGC